MFDERPDIPDCTGDKARTQSESSQSESRSKARLLLSLLGCFSSPAFFVDFFPAVWLWSRYVEAEYLRECSSDEFDFL